MISMLTYANDFRIGNKLIFDFSLTDTERIEKTVNPIDKAYHLSVNIEYAVKP